MVISNEIILSRLTGYAGYSGVIINDVEKDFATGSLKVKDEVLNPMGIVHGGAIFTLLDTVAGTLARFRSGSERLCVTSCSDIHYLKAIKEGTIHARAQILKEGKSTGIVTVKATDDDNNTCAFSTFEFFYLE